MLMQRFQVVLKTWWLGSLWALALLVVPLLQQRLPGSDSLVLVFELRLMVSVMGVIAGGLLLGLNWSGLKKNLWVWSLIAVQVVLLAMAGFGLGGVSYLFALSALLGLGWLMAG